MATLGNTTTPTSSAYGWILASGYSVAALWTVPPGGGIFTSVTFWAAGDGSNNVGIRGTIWDAATGAVIVSSFVTGTTGGQRSSPGGSGQWYTTNLGAATFIAGGTQIFIGWEPNTSAGVDWAYDGPGLPQAQWAGGHYGSPSSFAGHTLMSPAGSIACFATYTPVSTPSISSFGPSVGPAGTVVTVNGSQFSLASQVTFNGMAASFTVINDSQLQATVPSGATTGPIGVTNPDGTGYSAVDYIAGSVYGDDGSVFEAGCTVYADNGTAWQSGGQVWVDNGSAWVRVL